MTITYHAGNRIQGLSTDVVLDTPTLSDDFSSSTGWTTVGTGVNVNSTYAGALAIKAISNANNAVYKTITTIPYSQNFQATFKFRIISMAQDVRTGLCVFASAQGDIYSGTTADLAGVFFNTNISKFGLAYKNQSSARVYVDGSTLSTNTDYWAKYVYTGGTSHSVSVYSDSSFTTQVGTTLTQTLSGMDNNFTIVEAGLGNEGGTVTNFDGYIDDLKIYSTPKPTNVPTNSRFEETDTRKIYYYINNAWIDVFPTRGIYGNGYTTGDVATLDYVTIDTTGNATSFGSSTLARDGSAAVSNGSRGVWGGGSATTRQSVIDYVTIANTGNATSFGNLTVSRDGMSGVSSGTRGVFTSGYTTQFSSVMDYITISSTSNATSFGNTIAPYYYQGAVSNLIRGVVAGNYGAGAVLSSVIEYITIDTTGNGTNFGNLSGVKCGLQGVSSLTRGCFGAGATVGSGTNPTNLIEYITIATTGNSITFGQLTRQSSNMGGTGFSSYTRGCFAGGYTTVAISTIDYITIDTTGNATNFGNLTQARYVGSALSGS